VSDPRRHASEGNAPYEPVAWTEQGVRILDQTVLPNEERYIVISSIDGMVEAIQALRVRGAPLIGVSAAMGLAAAAGEAADRATLDRAWLDGAMARLLASRPTAVNLRWALERMGAAVQEAFARDLDGRAVAEALRTEAQRVWDIEAGMCRYLGEFGAQLLEPGFTVLTHCNTGRLATGGLGTALAAIYVASEEQHKGIDVVVTETRPLRQGARLTAWELVRAGIPVRVIADSAAGSLMAAAEIDVVITGADRIARNGDTANKIGTYNLAVLASAHGIPFYVSAPRSTIDSTMASGDTIPIELRSAGELDAAPGAEVVNPAFDVTPAELVSAIVTDGGIVEPPFERSLSGVLEQVIPDHRGRV
jgi:methylthioribose-1-phosphate isomerase